jgi:hypothetical protein
MIAVVAVWALMGPSVIGGSNVQNAPAGKETPSSPTPQDPGPGQDLALTISGPPLVYVRRPVALTLALSNSRKEPVKEGLAIAVLPPELEYIRSTPRGALLGPTVTWSTEDLPPESRKEIVIECRAKSVGTGRVTAVFTSESLRGSGGMRASLGAGCDLKIMGIPAMAINTYDTEDPVEVGKNTIYVVETRNEGTAPCTSILMTCRIPEQMEYVSSDGPAPSRHESGKVSFEAVPILKSGEKLTYKVVCKAVREGSARHSAILRYDQFDKSITDEEGTTVYR